MEASSPTEATENAVNNALGKKHMYTFGGKRQTRLGLINAANEES